ncbi:hypothetical protein [Deinococcus sp.]|uniref:hypothetical protein n=1 Tax=Deinococcus sp. TaxID=47478 RepID=UPI002869E698|nr:hypothetical protein [Deinococcus sp.]
MTQNDDTRQPEQMPEELREIIPQLAGEPDEDAVLDAQEAQAEGHGTDGDTEGLSAAADGEEEGEDEYIDADDLLGLLAELKDMLEAQGKEIRGLRREMRESQGQSGARPSSDRGGQGGSFRPREDRGSDRGGQGGGSFRPREDRGGYQGGSDRGGQGGGFRPREDRGNLGDREFRPRDAAPRDSAPRDSAPRDAAPSTDDRPRARPDRGWSNTPRRDDE